MSNKRSKIWTVPLEEFKNIIKNSTMKREVLEKIGMNTSSSHYKTLDARIEENNIDISHFNSLTDRKISKEKIPLELILVENSTYNNHLLKKRLVENFLIEEECSICGIGNKWNGKHLSLQLDHINGVNNDNRIENLRFLCPNCHSQTDTFGTKNIKNKNKPKCKVCSNYVNKGSKSGLCRKCYEKTVRKTVRPEINTLKEDVKELGYVGTGKKYGVSDNTVRKWLKN